MIGLKYEKYGNSQIRGAYHLEFAEATIRKKEP